jgi:glycosyltransferase involved in cell wall biosynthesis
LLDRLRVRRWVREVLVGGDYDVVVARYLSTALTVPRRFRGRLVFDADDIVKTTPSSAGGLRGVLATKRASVRRVLVDRLLQQAFHVWFVNPEDLAALGGHARSASLLPNAAMTYQASPVPRDPATLLIVGQYSHEPNREAVDFLVTSVLPGLRAARPDVVLRVVGSVPPDCAARWAGVPGVEVRGFVDDLGPEYARATLAVAPIHSGGGTQIKVIEALANGCPIVVSTFAHRGFAQVLDAGRHLFVAESASQWIDVCLDALGDPGRAEEMAGAASDVVRRTYGVDALRERVRLTMRPLLHPVADAAPHAPAAGAHPGVRPGHGTLRG